MLNKVPNNNDVTCIANIMLNEAPNSNDTMGVVNNVCLTAVGAQQFSMAAIYVDIMQKSRLTRDKR